MGVLLTVLLLRIPAIGGKGGDFGNFAPVIAIFFVAPPLGLIGLAFAIAAIIRREGWLPAAIFGVLLNLFAMSLFLVWMFNL
jgi:hypothetical protein